jgi:hypothetical protein
MSLRIMRLTFRRFTPRLACAALGMARVSLPRLSAWTLLLGVASQWEWLCAHKAYDWRASTDACVRHKGSTECVVLQPYCLSPTSIGFASPRWLSDVAGYGGPLLTWLPLLVASRPVAGTRPLLCTALIWYLSLIGIVRHAHLLLPSRWDPSGHCFVYGAQLLPLWAISSLPALTDWRVPRALTLWSGVLLYLSAATAACFHTASETAAAWLMLLLLHAALSHRVAAMHAAAADSPEAAVDAMRRERKRLSRRAVLALPLWLLCAAAAWEKARRSGAGVGNRSAESIYDAGLWLLLLVLLRRGGRDGSEAGEEDSEERVLRTPAAAPSDASSDCGGLRSRGPSPSEKPLD